PAGLAPGWDERFVVTRRLIAAEPALLRYVEHYRAGIKGQVAACLAGKLQLDPEDLRLHVLAELATTAFSLSGRHWVRHGGHGGRKALLQGFDRAVKTIPASLDLAASPRPGHHGGNCVEPGAKAGRSTSGQTAPHKPPANDPDITDRPLSEHPRRPADQARGEARMFLVQGTGSRGRLRGDCVHLAAAAPGGISRYSLTMI